MNRATRSTPGKPGPEKGSHAILTGQKAEVARELFEVGAVQFGEFKLKLHQRRRKAPPSPIRLNLRTPQHSTEPGPLTEPLLDKISDLLADLPFTAPHYYVGLPEAGEPLAKHMAGKFKLAATRLTMHKQTASGGNRHITKKLSGSYVPNRICLAVDEVLTSAESMSEAIAALEANGLLVMDVAVVVDRMQGGKQRLEDAGYRVHSVFTLFELLDFYVQEGLMGEMKAEEIRRYIAANQV